MAYSVNDEPVPGYRLVKFLGRGNFGEVWRATSPGGIHVALKVINLGRREGFKEFKALQLFKSIHYPNLTPITAFWLKDEDGYLLDESQIGPDLVAAGKGRAPVRGTVMVGASGGAKASELIIAMGLGEMSLSDRLEQCQEQGLPGIPLAELFEYMEGAARAIDFLNSPRHDLGRGPISPIQHCDIKPQNILIVGGAAQVCDFGLARELGANVKMTSAAATPAYGAPELLEGNPPSPSTDQYSLAISYVEMRTGALPFADPGSYMHVVNAHLQSRLELSGLTPGERAVIERATARDPGQRYESALKMVKALQRALPDKADPVTVTATLSAKNRELAGGELVAGYRLVELLHQGAHQRVWEASGPERKRVALLVHDIGPAPVDLDAIALVRGLPAHPRMAEMLDYWLLDEENQPLPAELTKSGLARRAARLVIAGNLAHETLAERAADCIRRSGRGIPPDELLGYMDQVAEALDFLNAPAHAHAGEQFSLLHCNLRSYNLLLEYGQVRLGNFASVRLLGADSVTLEPGELDVEPPFGPPEFRECRLTRRSDQYTLAVNYVQLRTGSRSSGSQGSRRRVLSRSGGVTELDLSGLNPQEAEAILRATSADPTSRFESCRQFVEQLRLAKPAPITQMVPPVMETVDLGHAAPGGEFGTRVEERPGRGRLAETTDTPIARNRETAVERPNQGTKPDLFDDEPQPRRSPQSKKSKLVKTGVALLLLAGLIVGGAMYLLQPESPEFQAFRRAVLASTAAASESDPLKKAELLNDVVAACKPYLANKDFADLDDEAARGLTTARNTVLAELREMLDKASNLPLDTDDQTRAKALQAVIDRATQLERVFPSASALSNYRGQAERQINDVAIRQRREREREALELIDKCDGVLDSVPPTDDAKQLAVVREDLEAAVKLLGPKQPNDEVGFRARLALARAMAQNKQPLGDQQLTDLWNEQQSLEQPMGDTRGQRHQAQLIVLRAWAAEQRSQGGKNLREVFLRLDELKPHSEQDQDLQLFLQQGDWESAQIERLIALGKESSDPEVASVLDRFRPPLDASELLQTAAQQLRAGQYSAARETLIEVRPDTPRESEDLAEMTLLLTLADPSSKPDDAAAAVESIRQRLERGDAGHLTLLSFTLDELAKRQPAYLPSGINLVSRAKQLEGDAAKREEIVGHLRNLYAAQVGRVMGEAPKPFNRQQYFRDLKALCDAAASEGVDNPVVLTASAESITETGGKLLSATRGRLDQLAGEENQPPEIRQYAQYARLLERWRGGNLKPEDQAVANELSQLAESVRVKPEFAFAVEYRRTQLAELLFDAAGQVRQTVSVDHPSLDSITKPYGEGGEKKAQWAHDWLVAAGNLLPEKQSDPQVLANLALAAWFRTPPQALRADKDGEKVQNILARIAGRQADLGADQLPILYLASLAKPGSAEALKSRADLVDALVGGKNRPNDEQAVQIHDQLIAPVLAAVEKTPATDPALRKQLARLQYDKSKLLRQYPGADWKFADRAAESLQAIEQAIQADEAAAYLVERGYARLDQKSADLKSALADAQKAIDRDPQAAGGHALQAKALLRMARKETDRNRSAQLLEKSVAANEKTAELAQDDVTRFVSLLDLGTSYVEWANFVDAAHGARAELLKKAVSSVEKALAIDTRSYRDYAYSRLGNAYEDMVWLLRETNPDVLNEYYDKAIKAFDEAIIERPDLPAPWVDRGRCYYKREADSGQRGHGYMDSAQTNLEHAIELDPDKRNASARNWLGKVYLYQAIAAQRANQAAEAEKKFASADKLFEEASQIAREAKSADLPIYLGEWASCRLQDKNFPRPEVRQRVQKLIQSLATDAPDNKEYTNRLYLMLGKTFEDESKWAEARKAYSDALPADLAQAGKLDVALLRARADLALNSNTRDAKTFESAHADIDRAIALLKPEVDGHSHHIAALLRSKHATTLVGDLTPATKHRARLLVNEAIPYFEVALRHVPADELGWQTFYGYAILLKQMMVNDPASVSTHLDKALQAVDKAKNLARNESQLQLGRIDNLKADLEKLKPAAPATPSAGPQSPKK